jgi:protocatechuate 3,4-dioxygenase beta subunit
LNLGLVRIGAFHLLVVFSVFTLSGQGQPRYASGPYKGFVQEEPELNKGEIGPPFKASTTVSGVVVYPDGKPMPGALFEIRDRLGSILHAVTQDDGTFRMSHVSPGTYNFKVTRNGFHSVIGKIVVSDKTTRKKSIHIQLKVGT